MDGSSVGIRPTLLPVLVRFARSAKGFAREGSALTTPARALPWTCQEEQVPPGLPRSRSLASYGAALAFFLIPYFFLLNSEKSMIVLPSVTIGSSPFHFFIIS